MFCNNITITTKDATHSLSLRTYDLIPAACDVSDHVLHMTKSSSTSQWSECPKQGLQHIAGNLPHIAPTEPVRELCSSDFGGHNRVAWGASSMLKVRPQQPPKTINDLGVEPASFPPWANSRCRSWCSVAKLWVSKLGACKRSVSWLESHKTL